MYLRSRRSAYSSRSQRRGRGCLRALLVWVLAPLLIFIGVGIYQNRGLFTPLVDQALGDLVSQGQGVIATMQAPTAVPTPDPANNLRLAESAWQIGNFQEATRLYGLVVTATPNDVQPHFRYTLGLIMQGRTQQALTAAEDTVTANPFHHDAWAVRALALNRAERYRESIASAQRALELNPNSARARAYLAKSYADLGNPNGGLDEVNRALEADPDSPDALYVRGYINQRYLFDFVSAREDLQVAFDRSNEMPHIGLVLWQVLSRETTTVEAGLGVLRAILERNPENIAVLLELGFYYRVLGGNRDQAFTYLQRCVAADPDNAACHYELGRVQAANEQNDLARLSFERVIEIGATDPRHYYWAGYMTRINLGDCGRATQYYQSGYALAQQIVAANPNNALMTSILGDFETELANCGQFVVPPTPEPAPDDADPGRDGA